MKIEYIIETAKTIIKNLKCEFSEIRLSSSITNSISLSGKQVDSVSSGESIGGSIRILKNGGWGFISFNDLNNLGNYSDKCLELAFLGSGDIKSEVTGSTPVIEKFKTSVKKDFKKISFDEKFNLINNYNQILNSSKLVQTTNALYRDVNTTYVYLNSEGSEVTYDRMYCGVSLTSVTKDGSIIQPFSNSIAGNGGYEIVENREEEAEAVLKTAVDLLKAEPVQGGKYNVVIDPKLSGVFIHEAFGHLSEADSIHENEQMKKLMTIGKKFGPDNFNVIDDGSIEGLSGFIPLDDEGIVPGKTFLIKNGILSGRLHSRETAYKMNENPTGNGRSINVMRQPIVRMTNTYIDNGNCTKEDIFNSIDNGIYAIDVNGGQTNLEMFTFTAGYGYEIKNGKQGKMFRDIVLSGNVFNTLMNIDKIGNDRKMFGGLGGCGKEGQFPLPVSFGGPHMLIKNVLIGGKQ